MIELFVLFFNDEARITARFIAKVLVASWYFIAVRCTTALLLLGL